MPMLTTALIAIAAAGAAQLGSERLLACAAKDYRAAGTPDLTATKGMGAIAPARAASARARGDAHRDRAVLQLAGERGIAPDAAAADIATRYPRLVRGVGPAVRC